MWFLPRRLHPEEARSPAYNCPGNAQCRAGTSRHKPSNGGRTELAVPAADAYILEQSCPDWLQPVQSTLPAPHEEVLLLQLRAYADTNAYL
ncbi:hypothetical protein D3C85_1391610 [compost metagenome]